MSGRSEALFHLDELPLPVEICPIRGARRLRLRFDQRRNLLKLTGPAGMNRRRALAWAAGQRQWVEAQIAARLPDQPFEPGATIPVEGVDVILVWSEKAPRVPRLDHEAGRLLCGGPRLGFERRIERYLKQLALELLSEDTTRCAEAAGLRVRSVSVGDAETRWGSCSSAGRIRYSWRLVLVPPEVRRLVVAHEVAHVAHLDHGPEFKALERRLFGGDVAVARRLLRSLAPRLKRLGRGS